MSHESSVSDFSEQWSSYTRQEGRYASEDMLRDYLAPLVELEELRGKAVCEVGCGNGRFLRHFASYAAEVTGIEPSEAHRNSIAYTNDLPNVSVIHSDIYEVSLDAAFDYVFCLGVLHHTPDPVETARRLRSLAKPGGRVVVWTYGREGNEAYIAFASMLRVVTMRVPHRVLDLCARALTVPLKAYIALARVLPVPMRAYMRNVLALYDDYALKLTIYDQLNPSITGFWTREKLGSILGAAGLTQVRFHHRHGYSWTAVAEVPGDSR